MSHAQREIASQPSCWRRALELVDEGACDGLPRPGERVAVLGCGTSLHMARSYAALRESAGHGETDAWPASEFRASRRYDRVLALTRTGTTTEVIEALARVPAGVPTTAVTADAAAPVARAAAATVALPFADERSVVQTRFPTTLLVLLRAHLRVGAAAGARQGAPRDPGTARDGADLAELPALAELALAAPLPERATAARQLVFLGTGWAAAIAGEAALKVREAARSWAESYPAMEYRHGPIAVADAGTLVWIFGRAPAGLAEDIGRTGAAVELSGADPLVDLVRVQRLAVELAVARGLDPDRPRHLDRSVILT
jgi:fructoselysine-6-P-deglycase FrlB-like protein